MEHERKIVILIFANIIIGLVTGFYWYTVYDNYLEKSFKEEYAEWKSNTDSDPTTGTGN